MSWFKLPDNLAKLKDEVTNFATEVLAPDLEATTDAGGAAGGGFAAAEARIGEAQFKIEELTSLCATQDTEVSREGIRETSVWNLLRRDQLLFLFWKVLHKSWGEFVLEEKIYF